MIYLFNKEQEKGITLSEYVRGFSNNGISGIKVVEGSAEILVNNKLRISLTRNVTIIDENSPDFYNGAIEFMVNPANDNGNYILVKINGHMLETLVEVMNGVLIGM